MTDIKVIIQDDNGTNAPLFAQYDGQCGPQKAFLETSYDGDMEEALEELAEEAREALED